MSEKKCPQCKILKPYDEFHKNAYNKDGHSSQCKVCSKKVHDVRIHKYAEDNYKKGEFIDKRFHMSDLIDSNEDTGYSVLVYGQSKVAGKTTLLYTILQKVKDLHDIILLFSPNLNAPIYKHFRKNKKIVMLPKYDSRPINALLEINKKTDRFLNVLVVLDDVVTVKNDSFLREMVLTFRNNKISTIICMQSIKLINKDNRANFNYVFMGKFNSPQIIDDAIEVFLKGTIPIPEEENKKNKREDYLIDFYKRNTDNYHFMVLDLIKNEFKKYKTNLII